MKIVQPDRAVGRRAGVERVGDVVGLAEAERQRQHDGLADPLDDRVGQPLRIVEGDRAAARTSHVSVSQPGSGWKRGPYFVRQARERVAHVGDAARARIVHRAAAERREAGGEDHRAIDDVFVGDDAFAQAGHADVEHRQDQPVGRVRRRRRRLRAA